MPSCAPLRTNASSKSFPFPRCGGSIASRPISLKPNDRSRTDIYSCSFFADVVDVFVVVASAVAVDVLSSGGGPVFCAATFAFLVRCRSEQALQVKFVRLKRQNSSGAFCLRQPVQVCILMVFLGFVCVTSRRLMCGCVLINLCVVSLVPGAISCRRNVGSVIRHRVR